VILRNGWCELTDINVRPSKSSISSKIVIHQAMYRRDAKRSAGVDDGMIGDKVAFFGLPPKTPSNE